MMNKVFIVILLFTGLVFQSFSQTYAQSPVSYVSASDSLAALIKTDQSDTNKIIHLNLLGWELMFINPDTSILLGNQAVELDRKSTRLNSSHIQKSRMPSSA